MDLGNRIFTLLKSISTDQMDQFDKMLRESKHHIYEELEKWEKRHGIDPEEPWKQSSTSSTRTAGGQSEKRSHASSQRSHGQHQSSHYPEEFLKDLATFNLTPPTTMDAVKKARNKEIKKYHPDRFANEPAKQETAKEILQLINGAFARLQKHPQMKE